MKLAVEMPAPPDAPQHLATYAREAIGRPIMLMLPTGPASGVVVEVDAEPGVVVYGVVVLDEAMAPWGSPRDLRRL